MPVLPVTRIVRSRGLSRRRFSAAPSVGANSKVATASIAIRLNSSGKGPSEIVRAQARLDMADRHAGVEGGERGGHRRRRVAMDQQQRRPLRLDQPRDRRHHPRRDIGRRLAFGHQPEVAIGPLAERGEDLIDQRAMLPGRDQPLRQRRRRAAPAPPAAS